MPRSYPSACLQLFTVILANRKLVLTAHGAVHWPFITIGLNTQKTEPTGNIHLHCQLCIKCNFTHRKSGTQHIHTYLFFPSKHMCLQSSKCQYVIMNLNILYAFKSLMFAKQSVRRWWFCRCFLIYFKPCRLFNRLSLFFKKHFNSQYCAD